MVVSSSLHILQHISFLSFSAFKLSLLSSLPYPNINPCPFIASHVFSLALARHRRASLPFSRRVHRFRPVKVVVVLHVDEASKRPDRVHVERIRHRASFVSRVFFSRFDVPEPSFAFENVSTFPGASDGSTLSTVMMMMMMMMMMMISRRRQRKCLVLSSAYKKEEEEENVRAFLLLLALRLSTTSRKAAPRGTASMTRYGRRRRRRWSKSVPNNWIQLSVFFV